MLILKKKDEMVNRDLKDLESLIFPMLMGSENETERKKEMLNLITDSGESIAGLVYNNFNDDVHFKIQLMKDMPIIINYVMANDNSKPSGKPIAPPIQRIVKR